MNLATIVRNGVALAKTLTTSLQGTISIYPWESPNSTYGGPTYGTAVSIPAVIDESIRFRRMSDGQEILQKAEITILQPLTANGASGRSEPIDPRDKIVLPSGYTGPIRYVNGPIDSSTGYPYMFTIILG